MGTNKDVTISNQLLVLHEVTHVIISIIYSLTSLGLSFYLSALVSKRFLINDCLVENNIHTPSIDLSILSFISAFMATCIVMGVLYYELSKSAIFVKIYLGIYGTCITLVTLTAPAIYS